MPSQCLVSLATPTSSIIRSRSVTLFIDSTQRSGTRARRSRSTEPGMPSAVKPLMKPRNGLRDSRNTGPTALDAASRTLRCFKLSLSHTARLAESISSSALAPRSSSVLAKYRSQLRLASSNALSARPCRQPRFNTSRHSRRDKWYAIELRATRDLRCCLVVLTGQTVHRASWCHAARFVFSPALSTLYAQAQNGAVSPTPAHRAAPARGRPQSRQTR